MNREEWKHHIAEQKRSGLSQAEYARRNGFSEKGFYYWNKRLKASEPGFIELGPESRELRIELGSATVVVPSGFNAEELRRVVEALC